MLLGLVVSLHLLELRLEVLLLLQLRSKLVFLLLDLLHQLFDLFIDVFHRGIRKIGFWFDCTLGHAIGFFILSFFLSQKLFSSTEIADFPPDFLKLGLIACILDFLLFDFVDVALKLVLGHTGSL